MSILERFKSLFFRELPPVEEAPIEEEVYQVSREDIEAIIQTPIKNLGLFEHALRHRSMIRNDPSKQLESNERLEFLGDAVLGMIIGEHLFHRYETRDEGFLTRTRSKLVNGNILAKYAKHVGLDKLVLISKNMEDTNGRNNTTILADAFEAVLGALYLDQGYEVVKKFILSVIEEATSVEDIVMLQSNYKSQLLEYVQARGWDQPDYQLIEETGPSHKKEFTVQVTVQAQAMGTGKGHNKKQAEQRAAAETMRMLNEASPLPMTEESKP
jgi:ribonuclease-3